MIHQDNEFKRLAGKLLKLAGLALLAPLLTAGMYYMLGRGFKASSQDHPERKDEPGATADNQDEPSASSSQSDTSQEEKQEEPGREQLQQAIEDTLKFLYSGQTAEEPDTKPTLRDRRRAVRLPTDLPIRIQVITTSGASSDQNACNTSGRLVDISLTGCRLTCNQHLKRGDLVKLSPDAGTYAVDALVVWGNQLAPLKGQTPENYYGLKFITPPSELSHSWVVTHLIDLGLKKEQLHQRRSWVRIKTKRAVLLKPESGEQQKGELIDIGMGGARVTCSHPTEEKSRLILIIPGDQDTDSFSIPASVVAVKTVTDKNDMPLYHYHLSFTAPNEGLRNRLQQFIARLYENPTS